jgi:adenylate cyclase
MKFTLRLTLTTTLVTLIVLTVAALGYNSHRNARFTAEDLSSQILDETSMLVESHIDSLLTQASREGDLNRELLQDGQFDTKNFERLARFWIKVLETHPHISRQSLGLEATGDWSLIRRLPGGKLAIGELRLNARTGKHEMSAYWPDEYPQKPFKFLPDANGKDPRKEPWYISAKKARRQVWSRAYLFDGIEGIDAVPGVSCSTPLYADNDSLLGVLTSSYDVVSLCDYLKNLKVGEKGFAFVVQVHEDGQRQVIGHPDLRVLIRKVGGDGLRTVNELVPPDELQDSRVPAFLGQVPSKLDPLTARRMNPVQVTHNGVKYLGAYRYLPSENGPLWLTCIMMPEKEVMGRVDQSNQETSIIGVAILLIALVVGLLVSAQVARPLERLVKQTEKIGQFEVEARPVAHSIIAEVDDLACVVEETKTSLRSFGKYVPTDVIRQMFATGQEATLGGDRRRMTVSFCDLANFTTLAEKLPPEELVRQMGDYFGRFSDDIAAGHGTVDKYIGDAIMAFWGAPAPTTDHAIAACSTALRNQATLEGLHQQWRAEGKPELAARIGIMTGEVVVGNIGSPARLNYTVMGDPVNLASRLEGLGKYYGTRMLIGEPTYLEAREVVLARAVDWVSVKGKTEGMLIYELLAFRDEAGPVLEAIAGLSDRALRVYRCREWLDALALFDEILRLRPDDGPATVLAGRCRAFLESPPAEDWDGVHRMASK